MNQNLTDIQRKFDKLASDNEILQSKIKLAEKTGGSGEKSRKQYSIMRLSRQFEACLFFYEKIL